MSEKDIIHAEKLCKTCGNTFTATLKYLHPVGWPSSPTAFPMRRDNCPDCKRQEEESRRVRRMNERLQWTFDTVKKHFADNPPTEGDPLIVANLQFHQNEYERVHVTNPSHTKQRRIVVDKPGTVGGLTFYRSGQSCFAPKGNTSLLPDHPVMAKLFERFGDRIVLDDKALAAVMANADIDTFIHVSSFGPITAKD